VVTVVVSAGIDTVLIRENNRGRRGSTPIGDQASAAPVAVSVAPGPTPSPGVRPRRFPW
jgi:hypothetical protein